MDRDDGLIGSELLGLCAGAERELVLIAPFIKAWSFRRLLAGVSSGVTVTCVTRWRPDEVAAGVSDLEVFDEIEVRDRARLLLLPRLHGKYFRADARCLVGSANLTGHALGWSTPPNIELMVEEPAANSRLERFEQLVFASSHEATAELRALVQAAAEQIQAEVVPFGPLIASDEPLAPGSEEETAAAPYEQEELQAWLPRLRQPEDLYLAYRGSLHELTAASQAAATSDLAVLDPPMGLPRPAFNASIGVALLQTPLIALIDRFVLEPRRFGAVQDLVAAQARRPRQEAAAMWQTTMRWLLHFLPGRYTRRVPSHSEIFGRASSWPLET